jgi:hypothetical protein
LENFKLKEDLTRVAEKKQSAVEDGGVLIVTMQ